jgi:hypothetical protein
MDGLAAILRDARKSALLRMRSTFSSQARTRAGFGNDLNLSGPRRDQQPRTNRWTGEQIFMDSIRPDNTDPIPLRASPPRMGTIMIRFVGLLFVAVVAMALAWSR